MKNTDKKISIQEDNKSRNLRLMVSNYENKGLYVGLYTIRYSECYVDLTVNLKGYRLKPNEAFIDAYANDHKEFLDVLKKYKLGEFVDGAYGLSGFNTYRKFKFNLEELRKYDSKGVKDYEKLHQKKEVKKNKSKSKKDLER